MHTGWVSGCVKGQVPFRDLPKSRCRDQSSPASKSEGKHASLLWYGFEMLHLSSCPGGGRGIGFPGNVNCWHAILTRLTYPWVAGTSRYRVPCRLSVLFAGRTPHLGDISVGCRLPCSATTHQTACARQAGSICRPCPYMAVVSRTESGSRCTRFHVVRRRAEDAFDRWRSRGRPQAGRT